MLTSIAKRLKHNILVIATVLVTFLFIGSAFALYNSYIRSDLTKHIFLNFSMLVTFGLVSLATFFYFTNHIVHNLSSNIMKFIRVGLLLVTLSAFTFAGLMTSLVTGQIVRFFRLLLESVKELKLPLNLYYLFSLNRSELMISNHTIIDVLKILTLVSSGLVLFFSLKKILQETVIFESNSSKVVDSIRGGIHSLPQTENDDSKRNKRKLAFGFIYKPLP